MYLKKSLNVHTFIFQNLIYKDNVLDPSEWKHMFMQKFISVAAYIYF